MLVSFASAYNATPRAFSPRTDRHIDHDGILTLHEICSFYDAFKFWFGKFSLRAPTHSGKLDGLRPGPASQVLRFEYGGTLHDVSCNLCVDWDTYDCICNVAQFNSFVCFVFEFNLTIFSVFTAGLCIPAVGHVSEFLFICVAQEFLFER